MSKEVETILNPIIVTDSNILAENVEIKECNILEEKVIESRPNPSEEDKEVQDNTPAESSLLAISPIIKNNIASRTLTSSIGDKAAYSRKNSIMLQQEDVIDVEDSEEYNSIPRRDIDRRVSISSDSPDIYHVKKYLGNKTLNKHSKEYSKTPFNTDNEKTDDELSEGPTSLRVTSTFSSKLSSALSSLPNKDEDKDTLKIILKIKGGLNIKVDSGAYKVGSFNYDVVTPGTYKIEVVVNEVSLVGEND